MATQPIDRLASCCQTARSNAFRPVDIEDSLRKSGSKDRRFHSDLVFAQGGKRICLLKSRRFYGSFHRVMSSKRFFLRRTQENKAPEITRPAVTKLDGSGTAVIDIVPKF